MSIAVVFAHGMHDARLDDKFAKVTLEGLCPQGRRDYYKFEALNRKYVESLHAYSRFYLMLSYQCSALFTNILFYPLTARQMWDSGQK